MSSKVKFKSGDRIVFYNLQTIPRKDGKISWVDDRPLCVFGYKKVHGTVQQTHYTNDRLWVKPDDRPYEMTLKDVSRIVDFETEENKLESDYVYLQDLKKGDRLYFGGGCIPSLRDGSSTEKE